MKRLAAVLLGMALLFLGGAVASAGEDTAPCVPSDAWTEVIPGTDGQHYSYVGGPIEGTPAPPPAEGWQANTTIEPHYQGNATPAQQPDGDPYTDGEYGLHYTSHGNSGLADWFYFQPGTPGQTIEHPAVVCPTPPPPTEPPTHTTPPPTVTPPPVPPPTEEPPAPTCHDTGTCFTPDKPPRCERPGNEDVKACQPPVKEPPAKEPPAQLAFTGPESAVPFGMLAGLLALLGSGMLWAGRKRT